MTYSDIAIYLTLLITIIGWAATYLNQRRLLERQIASQKENTFIIPRKLQSLDEIKKWVIEGDNFRNAMFRAPITDEIRTEVYKWVSRFHNDLYHQAYIFDPPNKYDNFIDCLQLLLNRYLSCIHLIMQFADERDPENMKKFSADMISLHSKILMRLDEAQKNII